MSALDVIRQADRALVLGIGGGGDVVGALAVARLCESLGTPFALGGVAWERFAIDPTPGPTPIAEIRGGTRLGEAAVLADPSTTTAEGVPFCESRMAAFLDRATVLVDVTGGPRAAAEGIAAAAVELECDLAVCVDVGGDALAGGDEPGLASPLCDAVMLAAARRAAGRIAPLGVVFGAGCDAELTPDEVLERVARLGAEGAWSGAWGLTPAVADELEAAAATVPTEASLMAVRCARGETGDVEIRGGRRRAHLSPVGALSFFFELELAIPVLPLTQAVEAAEDLEASRDALAEIGIRTELDYERERAGEASESRSS